MPNRSSGGAVFLEPRNQLSANELKETHVKRIAVGGRPIPLRNLSEQLEQIVQAESERHLPEPR